jgi:nucleotide-binding universal stress UspA family protein
MSYVTTKFGVLVCVDGSSAADAAVAWGTREAIMRKLPITLMHAVPPVVVGWPVGQLYADMPEWQQDEAQHVIGQARKTLSASLEGAEPPQIRT